MPGKTNVIFEDRVISPEEKISILNTEITTLRPFIIKQLLVIKTMTKEKSKKIPQKLCYSNITW